MHVTVQVYQGCGDPGRSRREAAVNSTASPARVPLLLLQSSHDDDGDDDDDDDDEEESR